MRAIWFALATLASVASVNAQSWSAWRPDPVFQGIEVRERCAGHNDFANGYVWDVQLRNGYPKPIDLAWAVEADRLRGKDAQAERALTVRAGEVVDTRHTSPADCSSPLMVKVSDVQNARGDSHRPAIEAHWRSKDPEPFQKEIVVQVSGDTVTGAWSSPGFSFKITSPLPKGVSGAVTVNH
jgi:hypothetical protein